MTGLCCGSCGLQIIPRYINPNCMDLSTLLQGDKTLRSCCITCAAALDYCTCATVPLVLILYYCTFSTASIALHLHDCNYPTAAVRLHLCECTCVTAQVAEDYIADLSRPGAFTSGQHFLHRRFKTGPWYSILCYQFLHSMSTSFAVRLRQLSLYPYSAN